VLSKGYSTYRRINGKMAVVGRRSFENVHVQKANVIFNMFVTVLFCGEVQL